MSTLKTNNVQVGQSLTASDNFTLYQPSTPDGTVRIGNGNVGSATDLVTLNSSGNLGIGTNSPATKVHISGTTPIIRFTDSDTGVDSEVSANSTAGALWLSADINSEGSSPFIGFAVKNAEKMRLDSFGNLGLGVTQSAWATLTGLQISTSAVISGQSGTETIRLGSNWYYNAGYKYIGTGNATMYQSTVGEHRWSTAPSGTAGNAITFTQAMTLDASGNLGIGTSSPASFYSGARRLVVGNGSGEQGMTLYAGNSSASYIAFADGTTGNEAYRGQVRYDHTNDSLQFVSAATERMRIDSSGNLLVGTSTFSVTSGGFLLSPASGATVQYIGHASGTVTGSGYLALHYNGVTIGSISQNGTTGVLYNLTSDYRLKNNPTTITGSKDFIMALQPKTWDWWDGSGKGVGFIAHEFMEVAKYSGNGEKDAVDADGNPVYQSIQPSSSEVMANIVAFIQEQQTQIETLTTRLISAEEQIIALGTK